jgi:hypothetical protein
MKAPHKDMLFVLRAYIKTLSAGHVSELPGQLPLAGFQQSKR